ncbi:hypothetical protein [Glaciimonas sp. PCH181]|uniref:hypothetical protein n=1 Tax=Glaciimonas sp. PCH181 TaxID=2133943 RepID=UPI000D335393|nr:hypothetical protein [Glaciimonas sp. PCH181]PUA16848.1 hypothetical protein C7W93_22975 [Glaciimonas sp. PCH181]
MGASLIDNHLSFTPASQIIAGWELAAGTLTPADTAQVKLLAARRLIKLRNDAPQIQRLTAQSWGATPEHARRYVLYVAGLPMTRWDSPIHSFSASERAAIKAAVVASVGMFERVLHAV